MGKKKTIAAAAGAALAFGAVAAPAANAGETLGDRTLVQSPIVQDGNQFDDNPYDWDIVTEAVVAVTTANPAGRLAQALAADKSLTAFLPNDRAFQVLAAEYGAKTDFFRYTTDTEQKVFTAVAEVAGDQLETILLYHVVPGATITKDMARKVPANTPLVTGTGGDILVNPLIRSLPLIQLKDDDPSDRDPLIILKRFDLNKGNKQIAHGIDAVLRPIDLK